MQSIGDGVVLRSIRGGMAIGASCILLTACVTTTSNVANGAAVVYPATCGDIPKTVRSNGAPLSQAIIDELASFWPPEHMDSLKRLQKVLDGRGSPRDIGFAQKCFDVTTDHTPQQELNKEQAPVGLLGMQ